MARIARTRSASNAIRAAGLSVVPIVLARSELTWRALLRAHRKIRDDAVIVRGGQVHPSPTLLDRLRTASIDWDSAARVRFGPMLTESILVDSREYRQTLKRAEPEAIGGEMEGSGVYVAAVRDKIDWALAKGVCDWRYDKRDSHQKLAADNAASLLVHAARIGAFDPVAASSR